jgi:hypothetical protein
LDAADEERVPGFQRSFRHIPGADGLLSRIHGRQWAITAAEDYGELLQPTAL